MVGDLPENSAKKIIQERNERLINSTELQNKEEDVDLSFFQKRASISVSSVLCCVTYLHQHVVPCT